MKLHLWTASVLVSLVVVGALAGGAGASPSLVPVDLDTLGSGYSVAAAVNEAGQVVGDVDFHAFTWTEAGGMVDRGTLGGGSSSHAIGVNEAGQVVGWSGTAGDQATHAFSSTQAGAIADLGTFGGSFSIAVNGAGQVVGDSATSSENSHGFIWTQAGGMVDLGTLGGPYSVATAGLTFCPWHEDGDPVASGSVRVHRHPVTLG